MIKPAPKPCDESESAMPATAQSPVTLDNALCFHLYAASHAMTRVYRPLLTRLGLSYPQWLVLMALWQQDGQSVRALGERLLLDSGTLSPLLKRLEKAGLVTRSRVAADERQLDIRLTQAGQALQSEAATIGQAILAATRLTPAACGLLVQDLERLIRQLAPEQA